jgi:hypothetical protein
MSNIPAAGALRSQAKAKLLAFGLFLAARGVLGGNESCVEGLGNATMKVGDDPALLQSRVKVRATAEHEAPLALLADADKEDSASNNKAEATTAAELNACEILRLRCLGHGQPACNACETCVTAGCDDCDYIRLHGCKVARKKRKARNGKARNSIENIASRENFRDVICPFFSTLINEEVLEVKDEYTQEELGAITIQAGLDPNTTQEHVECNFVDIPSGLIDLFNMEGNPNEHFTSTGINDCATFYFNCLTQNGPGTRTCDTKTKRCHLPNSMRFSNTFNFIDFSPVDEMVSRTELNERGPEVDFIDQNSFGEGNVAGSHGFFIDIFGTDDEISIEDLRSLELDRRFPEGYVFPR